VHHVGILAMDGVFPFDLGIACGVFAAAGDGDGGPRYEVSVCGVSAEVRAGVFSLRAPWGLDRLAKADTVIVPGLDDPLLPVPEVIVEAIRTAWSNGARVASICSGAFVLAATGLLDGLEVATHWNAADLLAKRYPLVTVNRQVLYVDHGRIITSAGASAGIDMCLHLVRRDHGQAVAADTAKLVVAPLDRDGGQSQFIRRAVPGSTASLGGLLSWMAENLDQDLSVAELAKRAAMSPRTLARRFHEQTGTTPRQWLIGARVRRAQELLEVGDFSIDRIATLTGFESAMTLRARFRSVVGVSPNAYRNLYQSSRIHDRRRVAA